MIFPTAAKIARPINLSEQTREWAWVSLHGKYGDEAMSNYSVSLDDIIGFESMSPYEKYSAALKEIALKAPIRLCEHECICGAATLGMSMSHRVPVVYKNEPLFYSTSHVTLRFDKVINEGLDSYSKDISDRLSDLSLSDTQREYLHSLEEVIESIRIWHSRYLEATKQSRPDLYKLLQQVPFSPARSFHEAVQSLWFIFAYTRLTGNWPGIGRIDWLLGPYLEHDLEKGVINETEAREIMASFFIKGCEWICSNTPPCSGDAQHYQNLVLAGIDENGQDITNQVTFLVLDTVEELGISDYPITVRLSPRSSDKLKRRVAEVIRHGGGIIAIYNEDMILRSLEQNGYPEDKRWRFANDGCWEIQIPGETDFTYLPFDSLQLFNSAIGLDDETAPDFTSIEDTYAAFKVKLKECINTLYRDNVTGYRQIDGVWRAGFYVDPTPVIDLFEDGCIENARSYHDLGPHYTIRSPHIGGAPDVSNSLYAIQKLCFEEKKVTFKRLVEILRENWENDELLRLYAQNSYTYYGNDNDEADIWHTRIIDDFAEMVHELDGQDGYPVKFVPGISTFGRQTWWSNHRFATAFGAKKGAILSGNDSPSPGTDTVGATAVIKSHCKCDLSKQTTGAALDLKLYPDTLSGENGLTALISLLEGFISLGGSFMQIDAFDIEALRAAQKDPQNYKTLSVRVSGWNARFVTLSEEWQNMLIERNAHGV